MAVRGGEIVLRPGDGGVVLIPDRAYPNAYTLRMGRTDQSYVDLDDPTRLEFDYMQRMADAVDVHAPDGERIRIIHVGGAALTLPRYVSATRPQSAQIVLEPDAELTEFVREHLPLPRRSGIKVRAVDGRSGMTELREDFADVVVVDAFDGPRVPADLTTVEFLTDVRRVLIDGGTVLINITDRAPFDYGRRVMAGVDLVFPHSALSAEPATLKGRRFGNVLLAGSTAPLPLSELARKAGSSAFPYRVVHGDRLTQLVGHGVPFTDADAEMSPQPPYGMTHFA